MELKFSFASSGCGCSSSGTTSSSSASGTSQKTPATFVVGTTPNAPTAGTNTWILPAFEGSYVILIMNRSSIIDMTNAGDGSPYITKVLGSNMLTINGTTWADGDILSIILITP